MKCETCQNDATVHVPVIDVLLCESCRQKIDYRIQELNRAEGQPAEAQMSKAYLADDVSVGQLVRQIDREHINAARETPPNMDYMRALQRLGSAVENALDLYRQAENPTPTTNWSCKTCGWLGLGLSIGEAPEYHRRWNSKQGKLCTGNLIKE